MSDPVVRFSFSGKAIEATAGETVAASLLRHGIVAFRSDARTGTWGGPYCGMGVCFDCRVQVARRGGGSMMLRACTTIAEDGLVVNPVQSLEPGDG